MGSIVSKEGSWKTSCLLPSRLSTAPMADPLTDSKPYLYSHSFTPVINGRMLALTRICYWRHFPLCSHWAPTCANHWSSPKQIKPFLPEYLHFSGIVVQVPLVNSFQNLTQGKEAALLTDRYSVSLKVSEFVSLEEITYFLFSDNENYVAHLFSLVLLHARKLRSI